MLDHSLSFEGEAKRVRNKIAECNLYNIAQNGSSFDSYVVLNNLPQWRSVVNLIKNGAGIVSLNLIIGYVDEKKKVCQYFRFRCRKLFIKISVRKIGISFELQPSFLKQELEHNEIYEDAWEDKGDEWLPYVKNDII